MSRLRMPRWGSLSSLLRTVLLRGGLVGGSCSGGRCWWLLVLLLLLLSCYMMVTNTAGVAAVNDSSNITRVTIDIDAFELGLPLLFLKRN